MSAFIASNLRREYEGYCLDENDLANNPLEQFSLWLDEAIKTGIDDPNAMTLATSGHDGCPDARIVLLKSIDNGLFTWFTNYDSAKGNQLAYNMQAALLFYWPILMRQVRVRGVVSKSKREDSVEYFNSRPYSSRVAAAASNQSQAIAKRKVLEERVKALEAQHSNCNEALTCPEQWGGYSLEPNSLEFWQGRSSRLHDRIIYRKRDNTQWWMERLQP